MIAAAAFALDAEDGYVYWTEQPDEFCAGAARLRKIEGGGGTAVTLRNENGCVFPAEVLADDVFVFDVSRDAAGLRVLRIWTGGLNTSQTLANGGAADGIGFAQDRWFVYWTEPTGIWRRDKLGLGAGPQHVVPGVPTLFAGLAVDDTYLYWTDSIAGNGAVLRHQKDGGGVIETLKEGLDDPVWIAVDDTHLYWAETGARIRKMPKAGGDTTTLHPAEVGYGVTSLAVDDTHVFYTDAAGGVGRLRRVPKGGNNAASIGLGFSSPRSVSLDGQHAYLADDAGIWRVEKDALALRPDLAWLGLEVTQGIQRMDNEVSLVADKETYVRAFPTTDIGPLGNVRAVLHGTRLGAPLPGSPIAPRFDRIRVVAGGVLDNAARGDTRTSFLFRLPVEWISGDVTLRAELNPNGTIVESSSANQSISRLVNFASKSPACAMFVPVRTAAGTYRMSTPGFWDIVARMETLWPIASLWVYGQSQVLEEWDLAALSYGPYEVVRDTDQLVTAMIQRDFGSDNPDECEDAIAETHWVGMVHPDANSGTTLGVGNYEFNASWVKMETDPALSTREFEVPRGGQTLAHEMAHNYNGAFGSLFKHVDCGNPDSINTDYPYPTDQISNAGATSHWGFDPLTLKTIRPDAPTADYMSYCDPAWSSDYTWENIFAYLDIPPSGLAAAAIGPDAPTADRLVVTGLVYPATNAVTIASARKLSPALLSSQKVAKYLAMQQPGPNTLELQRMDGSVAFSQPFLSKPATWAVLPAGPGEPFVAIVPWDSDTRRIRIRRGAVEAASRLVSANAPTITVVTPNGGEVIGALLNVQWNALDADGDPLLYTVQFSADGGATWRALATDYHGTTFAESLPELPATTVGRIRVIASDGVLTGSDTSDGAFSVLPHPPTAHIVSPRDGAHFLPGEEIPLHGAGWDADEGRLDGTALEWSVENVGLVGTGSHASVAGGLAPGSYDVTLLVRDASAATAQAVVAIEVGAAPEVEVVFPPDGAVLPSSSVLLRAVAFDYDAFAVLPDTAVAWSYDGIPLGNGRKLAAVLPPGPHLLTLAATSASGFTGSSTLRISVVADPDGDGVPDASDNCPDVANASQSDTDMDGVGQACDTCPAVSNPRPSVAAIQPWMTLVSGQRDDDADGLGNRCDFDHDQAGAAITASDFNHGKVSVGKLVSAAGCGVGGVLRCGVLDQDEVGAVITSTDFNLLKTQVGKLRASSCGAACTPPFGQPGKVSCSGPAC